MGGCKGTKPTERGGREKKKTLTKIWAGVLVEAKKQSPRGGLKMTRMLHERSGMKNQREYWKSQIPGKTRLLKIEATNV